MPEELNDAINNINTLHKGVFLDNQAQQTKIKKKENPKSKKSARNN
ncbi:hypothetical protein ACLEE4_09035 [Lonsdalea quercina]